MDDAIKYLKFHRIPCQGVHEGVSYQKREQILHSFCNDKKVPILVSTDLMARGFDFGMVVDTVIQLDFAKTPELHYNRVGRTARAGRKGLAVNLYMANSSEMVKGLVDVTNNEERIDKLFKKRLKNVMTPRDKKKMKKLGIDPPPSVRKQSEKLGIKPVKKRREFRFFAVQQKQGHDDGNDNVDRRGQMRGGRKDRENEESFDFESFLARNENMM